MNVIMNCNNFEQERSPVIQGVNTKTPILGNRAADFYLILSNKLLEGGAV